MTEPSPTRDEWSKLYQAAVRMKEMAPWGWMTETDVFGVQNPETDELGFVSVMGMAGEHYSLALYLGPVALYKFWDFEESPHVASPETLLEIPHLQASFENRNELTKQDRDVIQKLRLKFRGPHAWPMFRSYRPGFFPWYLEAQEARFLTYALEQVVDVALRFRENPMMLTSPDDEDYLVRVLRQENGTLVWEDQILTVPPSEPSTIPIPMDANALEALKRSSRNRRNLEMDLFMLPARIEETRGGRPYFAYILLVVDAQSGMILVTEALKPDPTLEDMWGSIPMTVVRHLAGAGVVPRQINVRSPLLLQLLQPLAEELGFKVKHTRTLRSLDHAKDFLLQRLA